MIGASMAELELVGVGAERQAHELVAEANTKHRRIALHELLDVVETVADSRRVSRTVAQEDPVGSPLEKLGRRRRCGEPPDAAAGGPPRGPNTVRCGP